MNKTEQEIFSLPSGQSKAEQALSGAERLKVAMQQVKTAEADRLDSMTDIREADIARLDLLLQELQPVFDAVPVEDEQWDFCLNKGMQPRLWLDSSAFVMIAKDRRSYCFVRDTRAGRLVLADDKDIKTIAEAVTRYIASRLLERERLMDMISFPETAAQTAHAEISPSEPVETSQTADDDARNKQSTLFSKMAWFAGGVVLGCMVLVLLNRFSGIKAAYLWQYLLH